MWYESTLADANQWKLVPSARLFFSFHPKKTGGIFKKIYFELTSACRHLKSYFHVSQQAQKASPWCLPLSTFSPLNQQWCLLNKSPQWRRLSEDIILSDIIRLTMLPRLGKSLDRADSRGSNGMCLLWSGLGNKKHRVERWIGAMELPHENLLLGLELHHSRTANVLFMQSCSVFVSIG